MKRRYLTLIWLVWPSMASGGELVVPEMGETIEDRYVVGLAPGGPAPGSGARARSLARELAAAYGGRILFVYDALGGAAFEMNESQARAMAEHPNVRTVEPDRVFHVSAAGDQADPPWGIDRIDQRNLPHDDNYHWDASGEDVVAFILDTGILTSHPDFTGRAVWGIDCTGEGTFDGNGHGTHVAGIVGGEIHGVAKDVDLVAVKVCTSGVSCSLSTLSCGVDFVVNQKIVNPSTPMVAALSLTGAFSQTLNDSVATAVAAGVFVAAPAGNSATDACNSSPASEPSVYTLGATTQTDAVAGFSNFGTCIDVFAPGTAILSAWNDGGINAISGTSMAAAHAAGAAASLLEQDPASTPDQVANELTERATVGWINGAGAGSPNLLLFTLDETATVPPPPPPPPLPCLYEEDFESGPGDFTTCSDGCTAGYFIAGTPDETRWQVDGAAEGSRALFTQPNPGGVGDEDVDGGACEALSPAIDARAESAVDVLLSYFHGQRDAGDDPSDGFLIEVLNDGEVVATLASFGDVTQDPVWISGSTTVNDPGIVHVRVRATDGAADGDIVEGGIDDVSICPVAGSSSPPPPPPTGPVVCEGFENGAPGWSNGGASTCTAGSFVVGDPTGTSDSGVLLQVGGSHSGTGSLFTATNTGPGVDDVDGGNCILTSPAWSVPDPSTLSVSYWHGQRDAGGDPGGDFMRLEYSTNGGATWNILASNGDSTSQAAWSRATAPIPAGSNVVLRLQCSDGPGPDDLIECGLDDVSIIPDSSDCVCFQPSTADTEWRHVALKPDPEGECQDIGRWQGRHLFGDLEGTHLPDPSLPEELKPFCVYTLPPGETVKPTDLDDLSTLDCHHPTRMALTGAGAASVLEAGIWETLEDQFLDLNGAVELSDWTKKSVRLALLDTMPTFDPLDPEPPAPAPVVASEHGPALYAFANALLYGDSEPPCGLHVNAQTCPVEVSSQLALPFTDFDPDTSLVPATGTGGFLGTLCDLAAAIWREHEAWKSGNGTHTEDRRLVLNLSLAWHRSFGGWDADESEMPLDVRAIYRVIRRVVGDGALVVAAAGNRSDELGEPGPFLPGAWESHPAPIAACGSRYRPLVYAAAGLRRDGRRLVNAPLAGSPPLAVMSDHAVVGIAGETEVCPSAILTGSSVASLVTSAAAAAAWHDTYDPVAQVDVTAAQVMDRVYGAGEVLADPADFCLGSVLGEVGACLHEARPAVHRVSVCRSYHDCRGAACPSCEVPAGPWELDLAGLMQQLPVMTLTPTASSPSRSYTGLAAESWTFPQPGSDLCPSCVVKEGTLFGVIEESFSMDLYDVTVEACGQFFLIANTMTAGSDRSFQATLPPDSPLWCPGLDFALSAFFRTEEGSSLSLSSPIYVDWP